MKQKKKKKKLRKGKKHKIQVKVTKNMQKELSDEIRTDLIRLFLKCHQQEKKNI